jgi:hypothetical protein
MRIFYFLIATTWIWAGCTDPKHCEPPLGPWTDREGRDLVFQPNGQLLWLTRFGSQADTQRCRYEFDCNTKPARLDMSEFDAGPYKGKTLLGIIEWNNDSAWRWQFDYDARPWQFDAESSSEFFKN